MHRSDVQLLGEVRSQPDFRLYTQKRKRRKAGRGKGKRKKEKEGDGRETKAKTWGRGAVGEES